MNASTTTTVTTTVASDPVFAVIEAHRIANAASNATSDAPKSPHGRSGPELPKDLVDRMTDADEAERRAIRSLVDSRPATMDGAHALVAYLGTVIRARDPRVW